MMMILVSTCLHSGQDLLSLGTAYLYIGYVALNPINQDCVASSVVGEVHNSSIIRPIVRNPSFVMDEL
jgi:hypothetical protein